jgi:competence protein ComEA
MIRMTPRNTGCFAALALVLGVLGVAGCAPQATPPASNPGAALVQRRCSICHTVDRINAAQKDEAGWNSTIDRMRSKGAVVSEQEQKDLVAYLVSK